MYFSSRAQADRTWSPKRGAPSSSSGPLLSRTSHGEGQVRRPIKPKTLETGLHLWGSPTPRTLSEGLSPDSGRNHVCLASRRSSREGDGQKPLPQDLMHEQNLEAKRLRREPKPLPVRIPQHWTAAHPLLNLGALGPSESSQSALGPKAAQGAPHAREPICQFGFP